MIVELCSQSSIQSVKTAAGVILVKREDLNPTGSHKDRAAVRQVAEYAASGVRAVVISSSGNAARATAAAAKQFGIPAIVFMSPKTSETKAKDVVKHGGIAVISKKPINLAKYLARNYDLPNLRPSSCELAVLGFSTLGEEVLDAWQESSKSFDSVFTFVSSAASFVAMGRQFQRAFDCPELHSVQAGEGQLATSAVELARRGHAPKTGALAARSTPRADEALEHIQATGGKGWLVTDTEVDDAIALLKSQDIHVGREAAASFATAQRALTEKRVSKPLVVLTGAEVSPNPIGETHNYLSIDGYLDLKKWADRFFEGDDSSPKSAAAISEL